MRLVIFEDQLGPRPGCLLAEDGELAVADVSAVALAAGLPAPATFGALIEITMDEAAPLAQALRTMCSADSPLSAARVQPGTFRLRPPLSPGAQVLCAGANYRDHLREMDGLAPPSSVMWFTKAPSSVIASGDRIVVPRHAADMVDYEGELAAVIGRRCYRAGERDALAYVGGYTIVNDVSARDWVADALSATEPQEVRSRWDKNLLGKQFPTFCPLGPAVVTSDAVADPEDLHLVTRVNGAVVQDASTKDLIVGVAALVSYLSQFMVLMPGDVISTGSPAGVGVARRPQLFLHPGDLVEVAVDGVGVLVNPVAAEEPVAPTSPSW